MAIINLQRSFMEVGRIRIGMQVPAGKGTRPARLETFRLTSPDKSRIEAAQQLYGGKVEEWQAPSGKQWQIVSDVNTLPVLVPPIADLALSQWFELWSGAGCQRRCDTVREIINETDCLCDPGVRECTPHTRLCLLLPDLPGLGVWRLDTQGYHAAKELGLSVENILKIYGNRGDLHPAQLRLDQRIVKRPGQTTKRFAVPMLDITESPNELLRRSAEALPAGGFTHNTVEDLLRSSDPELAIMEAAAERADFQSEQRTDQRKSHLTAVPQIAGPSPSIAEQAAVVDDLQGPKRRSRGSIGVTAIAPRTAEQADKDESGQGGGNDVSHGAEPSSGADFDRDSRDQNSPEMGAGPIGEPSEHAAESNTRNPGGGDYSERVDGVNGSSDEAEVVELIEKDQLRRLADLLKKAGFADMSSRRRYVNAVIDRQVNNASQLTVKEGEYAITKLQSCLTLNTNLHKAGFTEVDAQIGFVCAAVNRAVTDRDCWIELTDAEVAAVTDILAEANESVT